MPPETRSAAALALGAAGTAGTPGAAVELAVGLAAVGPIAAAPLIGLRLALATFGTALGSRFAVSLRAVGGLALAARLRMFVAALAVAVLRAGTMRGMAVGALRMTLRSGVAVLAALPVMAAVGLETVA